MPDSYHTVFKKKSILPKSCQKKALVRTSIPLLVKPVFLFSKLFAVFPMNENLDLNFIGICYSFIVLSLAATHLYYLPGIIINIERKLAKVKKDISYNYFLKLVFPAVVFVTSCVSKINTLFILRPNLLRLYAKTRRIDSTLFISDTDVGRHRSFSVRALIAICLLTFPINTVRLRMFYNNASSGWETVLLFANMYFQNISSCSHELQFVTLTYSLVIRVRKINSSLATILDEIDFHLQSRYNRILRDEISQHGYNVQNYFLRSSRHTDANTEHILYYYGRDNMIDTLTNLRKIHQDIWDAAKSLQKAYGLAILFSICCQSLMFLFDIYFEFYGFIGGNAAKPSLATYLWCLQYSVRFAFIVNVSQKMFDEVV